MAAEAAVIPRIAEKKANNGRPVDRVSTKRLQQRIKILKNKNIKLKKQLEMQQICRNCIEFRRERDFLFRKCKKHEVQMEEESAKYGEQGNLLNQVQDENTRLSKLVSHLEEQIRQKDLLLNGLQPKDTVQEPNVPNLMNTLRSQLEYWTENDFHETRVVIPKEEPQETSFNDHVDMVQMDKEYSNENNVISSWESNAPVKQDSTDSLDFGNTSAGNQIPESNQAPGLPHTSLWMTMDNTERCKKQIPCPHEGCNRTFPYRSTLKQHMVSHTGERPFPCPHEGCSRTFRYYYSLKQHVLSHTGEKPYPCPHEGCGRIFAYQCTLKQHMVSHSGEKPYQCPHEGCGRTFAYYCTLKKHVLSHTGEKPYPCPHEGCGKAFAYRYTMKQHILRHKDR